MKAVYARRLLKLASFLESLPPQRFDFTSWAGREWKGKPDLSCGTTACAMGWATTMPEFRRLGLRLVREQNGWIHVTLTDYTGEPELAVDAAAARVFGLSGLDTTNLFLPCECTYSRVEEDRICQDCGQLSPDATPQEVAANIREHVNASRDTTHATDHEKGK